MTLVQMIQPTTVAVRDVVSDAEWAARVELAACYRIVALYGMTDLIANHITLRVPDCPDQFLINPFGLLYEEITASSLYKIDHDGQVILRPEGPYQINETGYVIHSAIHAARPDVACIIHTHTIAGMAVSAMRCGLLPLTQTALRFHENLSYHDYEGLALNLEERERLVANLGDNNAMILRNHGLLTCGRSVSQALNTTYALEQACRTQVAAMASGDVVLTVPEITQPGELRAALRRYDARLEWNAMLRKLDRMNPGYAS
jgi:ribulose-5-phosphate 4-epimerase/fuculose-1-phosphate aldolase